MLVHKRLWFTSVAFLALLAGVVAHAVATPIVIDFESAPLGPAPSYSEAGVTFTADDGTGIDIRELLGDKSLISEDIPFKPILAVISSGATAVSAIMGDASNDDDDMYLRGFDASNTLVAEDTAFLSGMGMLTLSISHPNIATVIYGSMSTINNSSVAAFEFAYEPVPEPSTVAMLIMGAVGLAAGANRRRR